MSEQCTEHKWEYQGTIYWASEHERPGSSARDVIYGDRFFCHRCLETKIINKRIIGTTYDNPLPGTLPR